MIIEGHIIAVLDIRECRRSFDIDGTGFLHAGSPLGDINMMRAPVGHLPPRILIPPAERVMTAFLDIGDFGCLPLPQIPVQDGRNRLSFERASSFVFTESDRHFLQITNPAILDHFNGLTKTVIASLPGTDLNDGLGLSNDLVDDFSFIDCQR